MIMPPSNPLSLLLVADSVDTCERLASALPSAPAFYRIDRITSHQLMQRGPLQAVPLALVDANLHALRQAQAVRHLNSLGITVVALVDPRDVQNLQEVVLEGASALVAVPFVDKQLWETVGTALKRAAPSAGADGSHNGRVRGGAQGTIVAMYGPKGGSGTSVLAANLAVSLQSRAEKGVVLLEVGEGMGNQAVLLNVRNERTLGDLVAHFVPGDTDLLHSVLSQHTSGLRVLLSPSTPGPHISPDLLDEVIDLLRSMFDYVVIDCHASARTAALGIIRRAHVTLCVIVPEMTSLYHGRQFIEAIEAAMPEVRINVVLNRATMPSAVPSDAIRRHLKMQIAGEIPDEPEVVSASVNRGVPFVIGQTRSAATRGVLKLAKELAPDSQASASKPMQQVAGMFGRLSPRARAV
jgi:pilus assembly protein CpaE